MLYPYTHFDYLHARLSSLTSFPDIIHAPEALLPHKSEDIRSYTINALFISFPEAFQIIERRGIFEAKDIAVTFYLYDHAPFKHHYSHEARPTINAHRLRLNMLLKALNALHHEPNTGILFPTALIQQLRSPIFKKNLLLSAVSVNYTLRSYIGEKTQPLSPKHIALSPRIYAKTPEKNT